MNKKLFIYLITVSLLLIQCTSMKSVRFHADTSPSKINLPAEMTDLNVINRTRPTNRNVLDKIENITNTDRSGVTETINSFKTETKKRKYFNVGYNIKKLKAEQSTSFPIALTIDEINETYENEFVLASLEVFQVFEKQQFIPERKMQMDTNGNEYYINIVRGVKFLESTSGWRLYNSKTGDIIDEFILNHDHSYEVQGITRQNAIDKMETLIPKAYADLGGVLGFKYAERVSPIKTFVSRNYYSKSKSCPELKDAITFIKIKDWDTAKDIWREALKVNIKLKDIAKLHYNLGVYYEKNGEIDNAIIELEKAKQNEPNIANSYLKILKSIKRDGYSFSN